MFLQGILNIDMGSKIQELPYSSSHPGVILMPQHDPTGLLSPRPQNKSSNVMGLLGDTENFPRTAWIVDRTLKKESLKKKELPNRRPQAPPPPPVPCDFQQI